MQFPKDEGPLGDGLWWISSMPIIRKIKGTKQKTKTTPIAESQSSIWRELLIHPRKGNYFNTADNVSRHSKFQFSRCHDPPPSPQNQKKRNNLEIQYNWLKKQRAPGAWNSLAQNFIKTWLWNKTNQPNYSPRKLFRRERYREPTLKIFNRCKTQELWASRLPEKPSKLIPQNNKDLFFYLQQIIPTLQEEESRDFLKNPKNKRPTHHSSNSSNMARTKSVTPQHRA